MKYMYLAFDPGGTTGWASVRYQIEEEDGVKFLSPMEFNVGQLGPHEHHLELAQMLEAHREATPDPDYDYRIITESFEYRNKSRAGLVLDSVEYIGVMKLFHQTYKVPLYKQTASMGKGFTKDVAIHKLGLWSPGRKHAMDAMRHLIYFIVMNSVVPSEARNAILVKGFK